jgi:hypothetical protein
VTALSRLSSRAGKSRLGTLLFLVVIAAACYYGFVVGGVYWRRYRLDDIVTRELSFAGQLADQSIHQRVLERIAETKLPISTRNVRFSRSSSPRALRVSISYVETVNLLFTEKEFQMSADYERPF